jgi:hypothetical protein
MGQNHIGELHVGLQPAANAVLSKPFPLGDEAALATLRGFEQRVYPRSPR